MMKKIYSVLSVLLTIILMGVFVSCERDKEVMLTAVSVTNEQITPMYKSATISSTISSEATIRDVFVQYTVTKDFAEYDEVPMQEKDGIYTAELIDLLDNTTYYYRYAASNRHSAIVLQKIQQFATLQPTVPAIRLDSILTVWDSYAQVQVALEFDGGASVTDMGVCWGTQANPTIEDIHKSTKDTVAVLDMPSLQPNTQYYVRAYAVNKVGVAYSEELVFTTYALPEVRTEEMADIQVNTALLSATLLFDGNDTATIKGFCWSDKAEPTIDGNHIAVDTASAGYTYLLTALLSETQYFVRAYAQNKVGIVYGEEKSFTTNKSVVLPSVTTTAITKITETSAVAGGNVTSDGNATVTERGVVYGIKQNPTTDDNKLSSGNGTGEFTCNLANLQPNTIYYVRAYATNEKGTAYGEELNFTTSKQIVLPTVTTNAVTQITETTAVAGGNVTSDGNATVTERGVVYSTKQNPTISDNKKLNGSGVGSFVCDLSNLQAGTTYYVRAYAINNKGTAYGDEVSFTTAVPITLATVTTASITNITETTAKAGGTVTNDGNASVTERGVVYSTNENPTIANNKLTNGSGTGSFTCNLTGLQANTTYYVRAYAVNSKGTAYGEELSFTTAVPITLSTVTTAIVSNVTENSAVAGGNVISDGGASVTDRGVVYSTNPNPTTSNTKITAGSGTGSFTCNLTGLQANTTYYVRAYAVNSKGTAYGEQVSFTTQQQSNTPPTDDAIIFDADIDQGNASTDTNNAAAYQITKSGVTMEVSSGVIGIYNNEAHYRIFKSQTLTLTSTVGNIVKVEFTCTATDDTKYGPGCFTVDGGEYAYSGAVGTWTGAADAITFTASTNQVRATQVAVTIIDNGTENGTENGYAYVDLGLSVKWATCNVGANNPEDYGDYFAWGETTTKDTYNWSTYKYCNGSYNTLTKYNNSSSYGTVDNKTHLELSDDAARANWGGSWRMPTDAEWTELREQCTWTWTTQNGVDGRKVTSKTNGNSIFLPAAGYRVGSSLNYAGSSGYYWSSSLDTGNPSYAWYVGFSSSDADRIDFSRYYGQSVRPVCP